MSNEREHRERKIEDIYVRIDSLKEPDILNVSNFPISKSLLNAILYASFVGDIETIQKLSVLMHEKEVMPSELGDMLSYVLEHSVDFNEWLNGECERFIMQIALKLKRVIFIQPPKNTNVRKLK